MIYNIVPGAVRTAAVSGELCLQWRLRGPVLSSTTGMRQLKEHHKQSLVGLSAEGTWRHGERPADS